MAGQFIEIVEEEDIVTFKPEGTDTQFKLRIVPDSLKRQWEKDHTAKKWTRRGREEEFNWGPFADQCLQYSIVSWSGVRRRGVEVPCSSETKLKLPESIKAEIIRLAVGKELGELLKHGPQMVQRDERDEQEGDEDPT